ncbi:VOC family protein [Actinacidiphila yeochonensis]|uniref:VOC family protein n=1 Tax=Actinacidiphila yeochonensis TaxID=89050 RepID=UPI000569105D|nr:VOC family protein [Actinacidiphila yeochonensis]
MPVRSTPWPEGTPCWVDCQVDDPVKASAFYSALFGWEIRNGPLDSGGHFRAVRDGRVIAGIGPIPRPGMHSVWTTFFAAEDADAAAGRLVRAGGQLLAPPFDVRDQGRMSVGADPTGGVFGIWQAHAHNGAAVYNEHGAYCWNELHTRQLDTAKRFYAEVFDLTYADIGDDATTKYTIFTPPGEEKPAGGMHDDTLTPGEPTPSHWLIWFQYDGVDTAVERVVELGGTVLTPPADSPFGRMAVVTAPQGERFGLIDANVKTGEVPQ